MTHPSFSTLPRSGPSGLPSAWGVWGDADQLGTWNHVTEASTVEAAREIRRGARFNLDLPLHMPYALLGGSGFMTRRAPAHALLEENYHSLYIRDDKLDEFYLQASSQWDGLTHIGTPQCGFYNGVRPDQLTLDDDTRNGIEHVAELAVATRGVVNDVPRLLGAPGEWDIFGPSVLDTDRLMRCLDAINVSVRPGDVLLFRFGWMGALTHFADETARREWFDKGVFAGLSGGQSMWEFLWDHGVAAAASDSPTLEATPMPKGDNLHLAIPCLGFTIGEFFALEALAEACAEDGIYTVFLTTSPLNLRGGVGSPPNAIAIK